MVNPTGGFRPAVTAKASTQAQPRTFGTPAGATPAGALATPGGFGGNANNPVFSLATPASTPASTPGGPPAANTPSSTPGGPDRPAENTPIQMYPYHLQVKYLAADIVGGGIIANDQTLIEKPMVEQYIKRQQEKTNLTPNEKYQLGQAMLLNMNFDAIDRWGAAKHGNGLDKKVSVWEMTNSTFADLAPYYKE